VQLADLWAEWWVVSWVGLWAASWVVLSADLRATRTVVLWDNH